MSSEPTIRIFDTTLRDGEQSPGASLNTPEKLDIARALELLGVDIIEAGFPISSPDDFEAVKTIAGEIRTCTVAGLARCVPKDIERAAEAVRQAAKPRIHVFCATSEIHRVHKFERAHDEILKMSVEGTRLAKGFAEDVEFSPEDASRTEPEFLAEVVEACIEAGATTVNIPDTVGYAVPEHFGKMIEYLTAHVKNIDQAVISVHCHDDLGLAVANSLTAIEAGARQIECTINGIGERAGNCSLEEVVMAIRTRKDHYGFRTNINTKRLFPTSRLVSSLTGLHVQRNKAIVGDNAFAHEAGIHQHGMLKHRSTYEIMLPEDVGRASSQLVLGKHSGRHAFRDRLEQLGHVLNKDQVDAAFERFKKLADKKKEIYDEDLEAILEDIATHEKVIWELESLQVTAGSGVTPTATVKLHNTQDDRVICDASIGDGPVDAIYSAVLRITGENVKLVDYQLRALTGGRDAQGEVTAAISREGRIFRGRGVSTDIVEASALAYVNAINRMLASVAKTEEALPTP